MNQPRKSKFNVMFIITSMPVGGAETLLVNMIRRMDPARCKPHICCLKEKDVLGEEIEGEFPIYSNLIRHKADVGVIGRIKSLIRKHEIDAVITVGAGDKMFWGRLAAKRSRVPVILSALHSTGWPDGVGRMNRMLTPITDGFIAVAENHGHYQVEQEKFPSEKVFVIPNGVDTARFLRDPVKRAQWRQMIGISPSAPTVGIVAALRPEKNHELFLNVAAQVNKTMPEAQFVIAGDGPAKDELTGLAGKLGIADQTHLLGSVSDIPGVLSAVDLFALTSDNEASPVSILEAMSCGLPVVSTDVGSVSQSVIEGRTGMLVPTQQVASAAEAWLKILQSPELAKSMGEQGREHVISYSSLDSMTESYVDLIEGLYHRKMSKAEDTPELKRLSIKWYDNQGTDSDADSESVILKLPTNTSVGPQNMPAK